MLKMSALQLGVVIFAFCLTAQVMSQNVTEGNSTMSGNMTTASPGTLSSSTDGTTAKAAGAGLAAGVGAALAPVLLALHRLC